MNPDVPHISWPLNFETALSTNDPGLNITEKIYFVSYFIGNDTNVNLGLKKKEAESLTLLFYPWIGAI